MKNEHGNVYVVLSRSQTLLSRAIHILKGGQYTHAALSLDKNLEYMFSFGRRRASDPFIGCFRRERLDEGIYQFCSYLPGAVIKIPVSPEQYQNITEQIEIFLLNSHVYGYNYFGLVGNLLGKAHQVNTRFFCSEFVYHVLHQSGVCDLKVPRGRICPQDLMKINGAILFEGDLKKYQRRINTDPLSRPLIFNLVPPQECRPGGTIMKYAVEVQDLKKSFSQRGKGKTRVVEAVRGVTFSVKQGEIFGFLGPNGAGRTTCQRMLTTLLPIDSGSVAIAGFDVQKKGREVRKHIGYVSQLGGADLSATGRENLMLAGRLYGLKRGDVEKKIDTLADLLNFKELLDRIVRTYSGGQKRRLEIALGIIHEPDVLFMDEPTTGLDPQNRANLWAHIRKLRENGMTIFLTTHYLEEADTLADRLVIMDRGKIVAEGTPLALKRQISGDVIQMKMKSNTALIQGIFEKLDFVNELCIDGQTVSLYVEDDTKALPLLFDLLKGEHIELDKVSLSEPTLDDVFLKQTGRTLRDTGKENLE